MGVGAATDVEVEVDAEGEVVLEVEVEVELDVEVEVGPEVEVMGGGVELVTGVTGPAGATGGGVDAPGVTGGEEGAGEESGGRVIVAGAPGVDAPGSAVVPLVTSVIWTSLSLAAF